MKKILSVLLAATSILSFAACGKQQSEPETTAQTNDTTAALELIEKQDKSKNAQLIPFFGGEVNYIDYTPAASGPYETEKGIGLITTEGEVILDCVYSNYSIFTMDGEEWYNMTKTTVNPPKETEYHTQTVETTLIKADGSERLELKGYFYGYQDSIDYSCGRFVTSEIIYGCCGIHYVYDRNGNFIFESAPASFDSYLSQYINNRLFVYDEDNEKTIVYDLNGKTVFKADAFLYGTQSGKRYFEARSNSKYGIIDIEAGEWKINPEYESIYILENDNYVLEKNGSEEYLSPEFKKIDKKTAYNGIEKDTNNIGDINDSDHTDANGVAWNIDSSENGVTFTSKNKTVEFDGAGASHGAYAHICGDYFAIYYENKKEVAVTVYSLAEQKEIIKHSFPAVSEESSVDVRNTGCENLIAILYSEDIEIASPRYYIIYDLRSGEYLTTKEDNCRRFLLNEADGKVYYSFEYKDRSVVTDENGKVIYEEKF